MNTKESVDVKRVILSCLLSEKGQRFIIITIKNKLNVKEGTYTTYRQLCQMLEWCYNGNMAVRANQLLELQRHCLIQETGAKKNRRYHILKVYDQPTTDEVFYRPNNEVYRNHQQALIPKHLLHYGVKIVYKIQYGNEVYIGSTFDVMKRISNHFNGYVNEHTESMLKRGGTFELLEYITTTEEDLRAREVDYIKEYVACGLYKLHNEAHTKDEKE